MFCIKKKVNRISFKKENKNSLLNFIRFITKNIAAIQLSDVFDVLALTLLRLYPFLPCQIYLQPDSLFLVLFSVFSYDTMSDS